MAAGTLENRFQIARVVLDADGKHRVLDSEEHRSFRGAVVVARDMRRRQLALDQSDTSMYLIVDRLLFPGRPPVYRLRDDGFTVGYRIPEEMKERPCTTPV